ncbi:HlyD family type I secretion periplasmic adaptor subunit [Ruegeria profundi]|uniref:HlyD family type I secretion periplasmic adaptor subunit n=1 Tax=Ruegeria profundi TaxID=1685378 RepID=UPI003C7EC3B0
MVFRKKSTYREGPLDRSARLKRARAPRFAAFLALAITGFLASLIALSWRTEVPQITRAPGTIVPMGHYFKIETMEGGIVRSVHVQDGQTVEIGDVLIELHHPALTKEMEVLSAQASSVARDLRNEQAVLAMLEGDTSQRSTQIQTLRNAGLTTATARIELFLESQKVQRVSIEQQTKTLQILEDAAEFARQRVTKKKQVLDRYAKLQTQGLKSLSDFLEEEDEVDAMRAAAEDARVRVAEARNALTLAKAALAEEALTLREDVLTRINALEHEHHQLQISQKLLEARLADLRLIAPVRGVIQSVASPNPGEVIAPGETLYELLPTRQTLMVEARIPNSEVGHVALEHPVAISVDTFDARRFGKVEARLQSVHPLPMTDEQTGETYFRASFILADSTIGIGALNRPLQAGMTVVAEMTTGEQTLLSYLLKPVQLTLERAFNER